MARKDSKGRNLKTGESQRKDGMYQYRYKDLDNKRKTVYSWKLIRSDKCPAGKKEDVCLREKEEEIQETLRKGINNKGRYITLNDMFDSYLIRKRHRGEPLAESTRINYKLMWNKHIRESRLGNMKLLDIVKPDIVSLYQQLAEIGISYGTITFYNKVLSSIFNMAIDDNILEKNPAKRALNEVEGEQKRRNALTVAQQEELLSYARKMDYSMYQKLVILLYTMCRISEFAGLTWEDINFEDRVITIDHQLRFLKSGKDKKSTYHITPTKSGRKRVLPMTEEVYQILKEIRESSPDSKKTEMIEGKTGFLFHTASGKLIYDSLFVLELKTFMAGYNCSAKNKIENLTPHILRHTGCTRNAETGMDIKVLQYLMGHSNSQITNEVYNHVDTERARKEMEKSGFKQKKQK